MPDAVPLARSANRKPVPRGLARSGPVILSYGFRPFFLAAGLFGFAGMLVWVLALSLDLELAGEYGMLNWHAHEMLFGYATAALAGFMLTAIPNWTGRLPVSGPPLLGLVLAWLAGRLAMLAVSGIGVPLAAAVDSVFLVLLALIAGREIITGRNWKNLKVLAGVSALGMGNIGFHLAVALPGDMLLASRAAVSVLVMLVALVGGRIIPSFTRNWLARRGATRLPHPFAKPDITALVALAAALLVWTAFPASVAVPPLALVAAAANLFRLWRWRGWATGREPLVWVLHLAYLFIPLGLGLVAVAALGLATQASALHVLTIGVIGLMTLGVMTRASRGHTGNPLSASPLTTFSYLALAVAAVIRPLAEFLPEAHTLMLMVAGSLWLVAFGLFVLEYAPMLLAQRR